MKAFGLLLCAIALIVLAVAYANAAQIPTYVTTYNVAQVENKTEPVGKEVRTQVFEFYPDGTPKVFTLIFTANRVRVNSSDERDVTTNLLGTMEVDFVKDGAEKVTVSAVNPATGQLEDTEYTYKEYAMITRAIGDKEIKKRNPPPLPQPKRHTLREPAKVPGP